MHTRHRLARSLFAIAAALLAPATGGHAQAFSEISYTETILGFTWVVFWNGGMSLPEEELPSSTQSLWGASLLRTDADGNRVADEMAFAGQHRSAPHPGEPVAAPFGTIWIDNPTMLPITSVFAPVTFPFVTFDDTPSVHGRHEDVYTLEYLNPTIGSGTITFRFTGTHVGAQAAPEPATVLLLGAGLVGVGAVARRRRGTA